MNVFSVVNFSQFEFLVKFKGKFHLHNWMCHVAFNLGQNQTFEKFTIRNEFIILATKF